MNIRDPNIIDVTIKEGSFRINHHFLPEQVSDIAQEISRSKIKYMEISHGFGVGSFHRGAPGYCSDKVLLKSAKKKNPNLKFCIYISGKPESIMEIEPLTDFFHLGRVGVNVDETDSTENHFRILKKLKKTTIGQLLRVHNFSPSATATAAKNLHHQGADVIYITDSFGSMSPKEITEYIQAIKSEINVPIGFQARNFTGYAVYNSLKAYEAGADWIDGSLMGMGPGGGTTPLEILVHLLKQKNVRQDIDLNELSFAGVNYVTKAIRTLPHSGYIHLLYAKHKLDFYPESTLESIAEILETDLDELLGELKEQRKNMGEILDSDLRDYLKKEKLDLDVVLNFIKTGTIPKLS